MFIPIYLQIQSKRLRFEKFDTFYGYFYNQLAYWRYTVNTQVKTNLAFFAWIVQSLLLHVESGILDFGIRKTAQGIRNPSSTDKESRMQDCLGFPCIMHRAFTIYIETNSTYSPLNVMYNLDSNATESLNE